MPIGRSNSGVQIAQTFTVELEGFLSTVSVAAVCTDRGLTALNVTVASIVDGQPGNILASAPLAGVGANGRFVDVNALNATASFDANRVFLERQQQYAILFMPQLESASFQILGDQTVGTTRDYTGGVFLRSNQGAPYQPITNGDLVFEVAVEPIPEPTASTLLVTAFVASCKLRRRAE